jgi:hypothetical protein
VSIVERGAVGKEFLCCTGIVENKTRHLEPDGFIVTPLPNQCSALVRTCADANAIVLVREGTCDSPPRLGRWDTLDVEVFDCKKALSGSDG